MSAEASRSKAAVTTGPSIRPGKPSAALAGAVVALVAVGLLMVYSTGYTSSVQSGTGLFAFLKLQARWVALGLLMMWATYAIGYQRLRRWAPALAAMGGLLLVAVLIPGVGTEIKHVRRWIEVGPLQFQPSELAKITLIIYLAAVLAKRDYPITHLTQGFLPALAVVMAAVLLVEMEPDMGTAIVITLASLTLMLVAGARVKHVGAVLGVLFFLALVAIAMRPYRFDRIIAWWNPSAYAQDESYQVMLGITYVGAGQFFGVGPGAGRGKTFLPAANTDMVFATLAEETGLVGCLIVISLMAFVSLKALSIARRVTDPFGALLAAGIAAVFTTQSVLNIAVVTNLVPNTGIPLPFLSYGGSSLVCLLMAMGVLLSISRHDGSKGREPDY